MAKRKSRSKKKAKTFQFELTSLSAVFSGIFLLFLLTWIFILGILVGRGSIPGAVTTISDLRSQINNLQEMVSRKKQDNPTTAKKPDPDPKLAFYEKLSSKKDEVKNSQKPVQVPGSPKKTTPPIKIKAIQKRLLDEKKKGKNNTITLKSEPEPSFSGIQYTVQIASLGEKERAEKLINRLIDRGYQAYYYKVKVNEKTYYRVRCGRFADRADAGDYARKLADKEGIKGFVSRLE
jgi:cell division septation protein DedD